MEIHSSANATLKRNEVKVIKVKREGVIPVAVLLATTIVISACSNAPLRPAATDQDNDTVADLVDTCPRTKLGSPVDAQGCSLFSGSIDAVDFGPGDHRLSSDSRGSLAELVALLNSHPEVVLKLEGHTDNRGAARENLALSKLRVMSVVRFMVANGIDGNRLKPFGFGENRPIMTNTSAQGRARNRRIDMSVVTQ